MSAHQRGAFTANTKPTQKEHYQTITTSTALEQIPTYAKLMKELLTKKRKLLDKETRAGCEL
ncbi:hypothetical protein Lal_00024368 [Lupinus albus]|nr:hypothetical protein Lal_00024368 [Lupinus albus]